ncbi:pH-response transcription factor pacC/RIM101 [Striga asiatica]|uniref:pH-response transcription factor pacC/RIM101 n=1 Tax=Striga asiatica TaxID=4170 RepID=A0A5A7QD82_STRAF|nr:pH-response transcription factor pacC/RIM101 [Striga asiatica]
MKLENWHSVMKELGTAVERLESYLCSLISSLNFLIKASIRRFSSSWLSEASCRSFPGPPVDGLGLRVFVRSLKVSAFFIIFGGRVFSASWRGLLFGAQVSDFIMVLVTPSTVLTSNPKGILGIQYELASRWSASVTQKLICYSTVYTARSSMGDWLSHFSETVGLTLAGEFSAEPPLLVDLPITNSFSLLLVTSLTNGVITSFASARLDESSSDPFPCSTSGPLSEMPSYPYSEVGYSAGAISSSASCLRTAKLAAGDGISSSYFSDWSLEEAKMAMMMKLTTRHPARSVMAGAETFSTIAADKTPVEIRTALRDDMKLVDD